MYTFFASSIRQQFRLHQTTGNVLSVVNSFFCLGHTRLILDDDTFAGWVIDRWRVCRIINHNN